MKNLFAVAGVIFLFTWTLNVNSEQLNSTANNSVVSVEVYGEEAACFQGVASAVTILLEKLKSQATEVCKNLGQNSILQDVKDDLDLNISQGGACRGVSAKLKMNCIVIK